MYAFTQDLPISTDVYARIMEGVGTEPAAGCLLHAVVRLEGGLRYIDVWESREACDRFLEERVHPVLQAAFSASGATMPGEPDRAEIEIVDLLMFPRTPAGVG
jgi:quinol monooxygenase YgiN